MAADRLQRNLSLLYDQHRRSAVQTKLKIATAFLALIMLACALPQTSALAITAEVAKKCSALTAKAYPPRVAGNPAAGIQNGSYQDFRNYFNKCVANGGNPPEQTNQKTTQPSGNDIKKNSQAPQQNR
jgi:hypothetical protein